MKKIIILTSVCTTLIVLLGCGKSTEFPEYDASDIESPVYFVRAVNDEFQIWSAANGELLNTSLIADAGSEIIITTKGDVIFSKNSSLFTAKPKSTEREIASFPYGICREIEEDKKTMKERVVVWEVKSRFRDMKLSPNGESLAFIMEQSNTPLPKEKIKDYSNEEIANFDSRENSFADSGLYILNLTNGDTTYRGESSQMFAFLDDNTVIADYAMVPCLINIAGGDPIPVISSDKYEYGWIPQLDISEGGGVLATNVSDIEKGEVINHIYSLENGRVTENYIAEYVNVTERTISVAINKTGDFFVMTVKTDSIGGTKLIVGSVGGDLTQEENIGTFLQFSPSSTGYYYYVEGESPGRGNIFLSGLNNKTTPITTTGDVVPPNFIR